MLKCVFQRKLDPDHEEASKQLKIVKSLEVEVPEHLGIADKKMKEGDTQGAVNTYSAIIQVRKQHQG